MISLREARQPAIIDGHGDPILLDLPAQLHELFRVHFALLELAENELIVLFDAFLSLRPEPPHIVDTRASFGQGVIDFRSGCADTGIQVVQDGLQLSEEVAVGKAVESTVSHECRVERQLARQLIDRFRDQLKPFRKQREDAFFADQQCLELELLLQAR